MCVNIYTRVCIYIYSQIHTHMYVYIYWLSIEDKTLFASDVMLNLAFPIYKQARSDVLMLRTDMVSVAEFNFRFSARHLVITTAQSSLCLST